jgi:hypothetical protein
VAGILAYRHSPVTAQITQVPAHLSLIVATAVHALQNKTLLQPFNVLYHSKTVFLFY